MLEIFTDSVGLNHLGCEAYFQGHLGFSTMAYALDCSRNHERYHIPGPKVIKLFCTRTQTRTPYSESVLH